MYSTDIDILKAFYRKLIEGGLQNVIRGAIYLKKRPANSTSEDCVISFLSGIDGQIQTGSVTCNIYVQNVPDGANNGFLIEDFNRTEVITAKLNEILHSPYITDNGQYLWKLSTIISTMELEDANAHQHFVHAEINFRNITCIN